MLGVLAAAGTDPDIHLLFVLLAVLAIAAALWCAVTGRIVECFAVAFIAVVILVLA